MLCPKHTTSQINSDVNEIVWAKNPHLAAEEKGSSSAFRRWMTHGASYLPWGEGGLGLLHWPTHVEAIQARWVLRLLDGSTAGYKNIVDNYVFNHFDIGRGALMSSIPTSEILSHLPKGNTFQFWRKAITAFRALHLEITPLHSDPTASGYTLAAEPTFHHMRAPRFHPPQLQHQELWETSFPPPSRYASRMGEGLDIPTLAGCYDRHTQEWHNFNQMSIS